MYGDLFPATLPPKLADAERGGPLLTKLGVRGAPGVDPAQALLALTLRKEGFTGPLLDLHAMSGLLALALDGPVTLVEQSAAALEVLHEQFEDVHAALPTDALPAAPTVALVLAGDRGNTYVEAMTGWAIRSTTEGGTLYLAGDKQKGFERYYKRARSAFLESDIIARDGGMRVARLQGRLPGELPPEVAAAAYRTGDLTVVAQPGVFSSGQLDRASAMLLRHLGEVRGRRVLDLGCGAGVLGAFASAAGADVTMLDDDLAAVRSSRETLAANGLAGDVRHSDAGAALSGGEQFDLVVTNPPFHVGRRLVLDVALEFVRVAGAHLKSGGELRLVANDFLPYEEAMSAWGEVRPLVRDAGFKVLAARKR